MAELPILRKIFYDFSAVIISFLPKVGEVVAVCNYSDRQCTPISDQALPQQKIAVPARDFYFFMIEEKDPYLNMLSG